MTVLVFTARRGVMVTYFLIGPVVLKQHVKAMPYVPELGFFLLLNKSVEGREEWCLCPYQLSKDRKKKV